MQRILDSTTASEGQGRRAGKAGVTAPPYEGNGKQTQKVSGGTSLLSGLSSLHAIFLPTLSPSSAGASASPALAHSSPSACKSNNGSKSPCWTFLPVGSLEARKKRKGPVSHLASADGVRTQLVTTPRRDRKSSNVERSEGESGYEPFSAEEGSCSDSPSVCKPPTFEQLLCPTTDDEKDETAGPLQCTQVAKEGSHSDSAALSHSRSFREQHFDATTSHIVQPSAESNKCSSASSAHSEGGLHGWQSLHIHGDPNVSAKRHNGSKGRSERASRKERHKDSCKTVVPAKDDDRRKGEERPHAAARRPHLYPEALMSEAENGGISTSEHSLVKHQRIAWSSEDEDIFSFLSPSVRQRSYSPDAKRNELNFTPSPREVTETTEKVSGSSAKWTADIDVSGKHDRECRSSRRNSGCDSAEREKVTLSGHIAREGGGGVPKPRRRLHIFGEERTDRKQSIEQGVTQGVDHVQTIKVGSINDHQRVGLRGASAQIGKPETTYTGISEFFSKSSVPCADSKERAPAATSSRHKERDGRQSRSQKHRTRLARTRSCSNRYLKGSAAASTTPKSVLPGAGVRPSPTFELLLKKHRKLGEEKQLANSVSVMPANERRTKVGDGGSIKDCEVGENASETGSTVECLDTRRGGDGGEKEGSDAETQSGYEGGASDNERRKDKTATCVKKHKSSKEGSSNSSSTNSGSTTGGSKGPCRRTYSHDNATLAEHERSAETKSAEEKKQTESVSLTIPPHPLFIPSLRLSLEAKRRNAARARAKKNGGVARQQGKGRNNNGRETLTGRESARTIASTCVARQAACGVFGADSSDNDEVDDESASVRRERSLLSCLFTLPTISSPSRKQELRRKINRYAVFKLCSDGDDTTSEEDKEKMKELALDDGDKEDHSDVTCATSSQVEATGEEATDSKEKRDSRSPSTASLSSCSEKPPGKKKVVFRRRTCANEQAVASSKECHISRSSRGDHSPKESRRTDSPGTSDTRPLRFPVLSATPVEWLSEDISSDASGSTQTCSALGRLCTSTPLETRSASERLYTSLEPAMELKKLCSYLESGKEPQGYLAAVCTGCEDDFSLVSSSLLDDSVSPSLKAGAVELKKRTAGSHAVARACPSPASEKAPKLPANMTAYEFSNNRDCSSALLPPPFPTTRKDALSSHGCTLKEGAHKLPPCFGSAREVLRENEAALLQTKKGRLRRRREETTAERRTDKLFPVSDSPSFSSMSSQSEEQRENRREQPAAPITHGSKNSPRNTIHATEESRRRHTMNAPHRVTTGLSADEHLHLRDSCAVVSGEKNSTEKSVGDPPCDLLSSILSCNLNEKNTQWNVPPSNHGVHENENGARHRPRPRARCAVRAEKRSKAVCLASKCHLHQTRRQGEGKRQLLAENEDNSDEAWEDLGAPKYSTQGAEKRDCDGDAGTLAKSKKVTSSDKHKNAGEKRQEKSADGRASGSLPLESSSLANSPSPSTKQQSSSLNASSPERRSALSHACETLLSSSESDGGSDAEIPSAFDTVWKGSFRCALQSGVHSLGNCSSSSVGDPVSSFVDAEQFSAAGCIFAGALHAAGSGGVQGKSAKGR